MFKVHDGLSKIAVGVPQPYMTLLNGAKMPALGFGTWELSGSEFFCAVK